MYIKGRCKEVADWPTWWSEKGWERGGRGRSSLSRIMRRKN